jgi:hypothetical protein
VNDPERKVALLATGKRRGSMKYICLGHYDPAKHASMTEDERDAMFDECYEYDEHLRAFVLAKLFSLKKLR